jgi:hypothetical protein
MFLRYIFVPLSIYYIVNIYLNRFNVIKVYKVLITIGLLQLPVVLIQRIFGSILVSYSKTKINISDFYFGTFPFSSDVSMNFFLVLLVVFLLYDNANNYLVKNKIIYSFLYSITVLLSGTDILRLLIVFIWIIFSIITLFNRKDNKVTVTVIIIIIPLSLILFNNLINDAVFVGIQKIKKFNKVSSQEMIDFAYGKYSRHAGILYFLEQPLKIVGEGPGKYVNPINRSYRIGIVGQLLTFYAEIGILGLIVGYWVLFSMTKSKYFQDPQNNINIIYFGIISAITITHFVLSDVTILFVYNIFIRSHMLSKKVNYS